MNKLLWSFILIFGVLLFLFLFGIISYHVQKWFFPKSFFKSRVVYTGIKGIMKLRKELKKYNPENGRNFKKL